MTGCPAQWVETAATNLAAMPYWAIFLDRVERVMPRMRAARVMLPLQAVKVASITSDSHSARDRPCCVGKS